eukprot:SAG11_NODE_14796_length_599_cov_1.074000_1_plen_35_part_01
MHSFFTDKNIARPIFEHYYFRIPPPSMPGMDTTAV